MNITKFKITYLFVFCLCLTYTAEAQQKLIQIEPQTVEVKEAFRQIENQTGVHFMYSDKDKALTQQVYLSPATGTLDELLSQISQKTELSFKITGNSIAVRQADIVKQPSPGAIRGTVTDEDGRPVAGATITLSGGSRALATGSDGSFIFRDVPPGKYQLITTYVGHQEIKQTVRVGSGRTADVSIEMMATTGNTRLSPVVVTGQYRPQSIDKSIYRVEVITKQQIENMAVTNVGELLKQQINIDILNESGTGRTKLRVLGLNSQYMKILMDNIPIAGDESMGSDVDLSTISLDDVERVEIVKGAMGVEYGANSISGVINIITKKSAQHKIDITLESQEETVRTEYNWKGDGNGKGRHIQRMKITSRVADNLSVGITGSRDLFQGFWDQYRGAAVVPEPLWEDYVNSAGETRTNYYPIENRGYLWSPKESKNVNPWVSYTGRHLSVFYKFGYFRSMLTNHSHRADAYLLKLERILINASTNDDYKNTRYNHHLSIRGDFWKNTVYSVDASFQKNGLEHRRQGINIEDNTALDPINGTPGGKPPIDWEKYYQSKGFYAKGSLVKPLIKDKLDYNLGFEMDNTTGNQGVTNWFGSTSLGDAVEKTLFTGAVYTSAEWRISKKLMIRPGFRGNFSSRQKSRTNESVTTRLKLNKRNDLRLIAGTSTRYPNFDEMYMSYVDVIHNYHGNPDLRPEYGQSIELQWARRQELSGNLHLETSLSSMFQHIKDRIINVTIEDTTGHLTGDNTYANENKYNGLLNQININLVSEKFNIAIAGSALGYRGDDDASVADYKGFLTVWQGNIQAAYLLPLDIRLSAFYRYVGREPSYVFVEKPYEEGRPAGYWKILTKTDAYHNMDANIARSFFDKKIDIRMGVRNIFDVKDIRFTPVNVPDEMPPYAMTGTERAMRLFYGRSWFVKLTYNFFK